MTRHYEGSDGIPQAALMHTLPDSPDPTGDLVDFEPLNEPVRRIEASDIAGFGPLVFNPDGTTTLTVELKTGEVLDVPGVWERVEEAG